MPRPVRSQLVYVVDTTKANAEGTVGVGGKSWSFVRTFFFVVRPFRGELVRCGPLTFRIKEIVHGAQNTELAVILDGYHFEYTEGEDPEAKLDQEIGPFLDSMKKNGFTEE